MTEEIAEICREVYEEGIDRDYRPLPKEYPEIKALLDKHKGNKVLLIDDKDFDGTGCLYTAYNLLQRTHGGYLKYYNNHQHGVDESIMLESNFDYYDLVIIMDSSTNLTHLYTGCECDVIVLDHHEGQSTDINQGSNIIINCNSKNTEGLECISAGMLCYLVFNQYYIDNTTEQEREEDNLDLFEIGVCTLYSDIVPVDNTVARFLLEYAYKGKGQTQLIKLLNKFNKPLNKTTLQWNIIPLINYTRRLNDSDTLGLLIQQNFSEYIVDYLIKNRTRGNDILKTLDLYKDIKEYENFIYCDLSIVSEFLLEPISNFKGLFCNIVARRYNRPVVSGIRRGNEIEISVRSNLIDSLNKFATFDYIEGGGHKNACGFVVKDAGRLDEMLQDYDSYLSNTKVELVPVISVDNYQEIKDNYDILKVALMNELAYSNIDPIVFCVKNMESKFVQQLGYSYVNIDGVNSKVFGNGLKYKDLLLQPVLIDITTGSFRFDVWNQDEQKDYFLGGNDV